MLKSRKLAVLLFIHGDNLSWGSGNYVDASLISFTKKVIVITINYRLGVFGESFSPFFIPLPPFLLAESNNNNLFSATSHLHLHVTCLFNRLEFQVKAFLHRKYTDASAFPLFSSGSHVNSKFKPVLEPRTSFLALDERLGCRHTLIRTLLLPPPVCLFSRSSLDVQEYSTHEKVSQMRNQFQGQKR